MVYRLIIIAFLLSGCSAMEIATDAALLADLSQTLEIAAREDKYEKYNFILGENPSQSDVNNYFAGALALNTLIHRDWTWLPTANKYRKKLLPYYQGGLLGIELFCIKNNYNIGVKIEF